MVGALAHRDYQISDQTVGNILKRHGIPPAPQRTHTMTWREFIRIHLDVLRATDFFTHAVCSWLARVMASMLLASASVVAGEMSGVGWLIITRSGYGPC
jgi:hypothetical protein